MKLSALEVPANAGTAASGYSAAFGERIATMTIEEPKEMRITADMELNQVIAIDEDRMLRTLTWIAPELGRLQAPHPLRSVVGSVTVEQAARLGQVPIKDMLYALNLAAGEPEDGLSKELRGEVLSDEG